MLRRGLSLTALLLAVPIYLVVGVGTGLVSWWRDVQLAWTVTR